jgi:hypothetical protein
MADGVSFRGFAVLRGSFDLAVYEQSNAKWVQNKFCDDHRIRQRLRVGTGQDGPITSSPINFKPQRVGPPRRGTVL